MGLSVGGSGNYLNATELQMGQPPTVRRNETMKPDDSKSELDIMIRDAGLRVTSPRRSTLAVLRRSSSPLTHAEVAAELAGERVDRATAFRNLNDLADAGLVRRQELGDHVWRFEAIAAGKTPADCHPHFLCVDCGRVSCLSGVQLTAQSRRRSGQVGRVTEVLLRGHCNDCDTT